MRRPILLSTLAVAMAVTSATGANAERRPDPYCSASAHRVCLQKCDASFGVSLDYQKVKACKSACAIKRASCASPKMKKSS